MEFENKTPDWENTGTEPTSELKEAGFTAGYKPPAAYFNWFWSLVLRCIKELQAKLKGHADSTSNPHKVTKSQVGLGNVTNVAQASSTDFNSHKNNKSNPHGVTALQAGAHALSERGVLIAPNSSLDEFKTAGDYFVSGENDAKTITNSPMTGSGYRLIVEVGYVPGYIRQYAIGVAGNIQTRYFQNEWTPWMKIINSLDMEDSIYYHATEQLSNEDLDELLTPGHYYAPGSNTCLNSPAPSGSGFGLEVVQSAGGYYTQLCFVANVIHIRYYNGSSWVVWKQMLSESDKYTVSRFTMSASNWSGGLYSFESSFSPSVYDIEIYLDGNNATATQKTAYDVAEIVGLLSGNKVKAFGEVPTIDIPIVIKAVKK